MTSFHFVPSAGLQRVQIADAKKVCFQVGMAYYVLHTMKNSNYFGAALLSNMFHGKSKPLLKKVIFNVNLIQCSILLLLFLPYKDIARKRLIFFHLKK